MTIEDLRYIVARYDNEGMVYIFDEKGRARAATFEPFEYDQETVYHGASKGVWKKPKKATDLIITLL